jgi:hypothetical protein
MSETSSRGRRNVLRSDEKISLPPILKKQDPLLVEKKEPLFNIRRRPIDFSRELAEIIKGFVIDNIDKELSKIEPPDCLPGDMGFEVHRFVLALKAYYESNIDRSPIKREILFQGITDRNFAGKLKAYRTECFLNSVSGLLTHEAEKIHDFPARNIFDIGEIFNYNYWIFWKEEDPDDYKWGLVPEKTIEPELLDKFKDHLFKMLPEYINPVQEEEILLKQSSSTCIREDFSKSRVYKEKEYRNEFSDKPLKGKRCVVRVGPENTRDSIMLTVSQSNSVKLIEEQLSLICQEISGSTHLKDPIEFKKELDRFYYEYDFFYDRDITKEGITKPRQLILTILDVLESKYPYFPCWRYRGIYSGYTLIVENDEIEMIRGHGLGMGNSLTTIMQATLNSLILEDYYSEEMNQSEIGFLTWNDDYTAGFKNVEDLENYVEADQDICEKFQIIPKLNKTHKIYDKGFVFCEHYYPPYMNRKESYKLTEVYNTFALGNILNAKEYFSMISSKMTPDVSLVIMKELVNKFGYEFYPDEWKEPFIFGGWLNPSINQVRLDLYDIDLTYEKIRAYYSIKSKFKLRFKKKKRRKIEKIYNSPVIQIFGDNLEFPDFFKERLAYKCSQNDIDYLYMFYKNDSLYNKYIEKLYKFRQNIFSKRICIIPSKIDIFQDLLERYPLIDFLPPKDNLIEEDFEQGSNREKIPLRIPNETLSMIRFFNHDKVNDNVLPYIRQFIGRDTFKFEILSLTEKYSESIFPLIDQRYTDCQLNFLEYDVIRVDSDNYCIDPDRVASAYLTITGRKKFPIVKNIKGREQYTSKEDDRIYQILCSTKAKTLLNLVELLGYDKIKNVLDDIEDFPYVSIGSAYYISKYSRQEPKKVYIEEDKPTSKYTDPRSFEAWMNSDDKPVYEHDMTPLFYEAYHTNQSRLDMNIYIQDRQNNSKIDPELREMSKDYIFLFDLIDWQSNDYQQKGLYQIFYPKEEPSDSDQEFDLFGME